MKRTDRVGCKGRSHVALDHLDAMLIRIIGKFVGVRLYRTLGIAGVVGGSDDPFAASRVAHKRVGWMVLTGAKCMRSDHLDRNRCACGSQYQWTFLVGVKD